MSKVFEIQLTALEPYVEKGPHGYNATKLTFQVIRSPDVISFEVPILVSKELDDAEKLSAARAYLHKTFKALADETAEWDMTAEEFALLKQDKKSR